MAHIPELPDGRQMMGDSDFHTSADVRMKGVMACPKIRKAVSVKSVFQVW